MTPRRPEIFVSATSSDLRTCRQLVKDALLTLGCVPVEQSNFPPDYRSVRDMLRGKISACNAVIHIVGECYGAEPATRPADQPRRSYTQIEYDLARELRKPLYVFLCGDSFPYDAHAPEDAEKCELQRAHRALLGASETMRTKVASRDDLALRVRELQTHVESLSRELQKTRSWLGRGVAAALVVLVGLGVIVWLLKGRAERAEQQTAAVKSELASVHLLLSTVLERYNKQAAPGEELSPEQRLDRAVNSVAGETNRDAASVRSEFDQVVGQIQNDPKANLYDRALAQFAAQDFAGAAATAMAAAGDIQTPVLGDAGVVRARKTQQSAALLLAGNAYKALGHLTEAASAFASAGRVSDEKTTAWADAQWGLGYAFWAQARAAFWSERAPLLRQALGCYAAAGEVRTRAAYPPEWARLQYQTSLVLADLAAITPMPEHATLWAQTVAARKSALEILTRDTTPMEWAWITVELGHALIPYAWTVEGSARTERLAESIAAYRAVLAASPRETQPEGWLQVQGFLSATLRYFAWNAAEPERSTARREAIAILRAMLEVQTRDTRPLDWATTQSNLGMTLCDQAEVSSGTEREALLADAIAAQRASLEVFSPQSTMANWAASQQALGHALLTQAATATGLERTAALQAASGAFHAALQFFTPAIDANRQAVISSQLAMAQQMLAQ